MHDDGEKLKYELINNKIIELNFIGEDNKMSKPITCEECKSEMILIDTYEEMSCMRIDLIYRCKTCNHIIQKVIFHPQAKKENRNE